MMLSKSFAAAMQVNSQTLRRGVEFVIASGAIEMPLGIIATKLKSTLARGTDHECMVELHATVVDTTAYDVILGMEFVATVRGAYDAYTKQFTYRWDNGSGGLRSHSIPAPCHASVLPVMAYACFGGLQDVEDANEDLTISDEEWGYHTSPLQLAAFCYDMRSQLCHL